MLVGEPILSKIRCFKIGERIGIYLPAKMVKELDLKKDDYVIPSYVSRTDNKEDEVFGKSKLILVFYRNKSGRIYNPNIELESDRDV